MEQYEILVHKMKIGSQYLHKYSIFPKEAYESGESARSFLRHVKLGNIENVYKMLQGDPCLVY